MDENARNRFIFCCRKANKLPMIIVSTEIKNKILYQLAFNGAKALYKTETNTNKMAPFEITDKYEVTETGEPSYTSAVHKWKGTAEILNPKPAINKINEKICSGLPFKCAGNSVKFKVPVLPYNIEIPKSNNPDENAEEMIILKAASDERFFSRSKLASAASGIVESSNAR